MNAGTEVVFRTRFVVFHNCSASDPFQVVPFSMSQNIDAAFAQTVAQKHGALLTSDAPALYLTRLVCTVSARLTKLPTLSLLFHQKVFTLVIVLQMVMQLPSTVPWSRLFKEAVPRRQSFFNISPPRYSKPNIPWIRDRSIRNRPLTTLSSLMLDPVNGIEFWLQVEDIRKQAGIFQRQTFRVCV